MAYTSLLALHKLTVATTLALFLLRNTWRLTGSSLLDRKWLKIAPHLNDTLLLSAAIGMLFVARLNPLEHGWLIAKFIALLTYISLGSIALKRGRTPLQQNLAFAGALLVFGYIVAVAFTKQVMPL